MGAPSKEAQALKAGLNARIAENHDKRDALVGKIRDHNEIIRTYQAQRDALLLTIRADEDLLASVKPGKARSPKKDTPDA